MDLVTAEEAAELTDDPVALELLTDDSLDIVEPDDPFFQETARLTNKIGALQARIPSRQLEALSALLKGKTKTYCNQELGIAYSTIQKAIESEDGQAYVACNLRLTRLRKGPSMEARAAMLWRIACNNEDSNPRVSISALDTLNKQEGRYLPDDMGTSGVVVNIKQFNVNPPGVPDNKMPDMTSEKEVIEGEFTPIKVSVEVADE